jgi:hypothetical protein
MSENKTPGDEPQEASFNEDFDFGEGDHEVPHVIRGNEKQGPNKKLFVGIFAAIIVVVGALGYKFYGSSSKSATSAQSTAATTTPSPIAKKEKEAAESFDVSPPPISSKATTATPSATRDQNFGDLAQAFSSTDQAAVPPPAPPTTAKEGTIQDLQKELFAPEHPKAAQTSPTTAEGKTDASTVKSAQAQLGTVVSATDVTGLNDSLSKLSQQIDYISNKIKYLDSYTHEMSDNLNKLNETITSMDSRVSTLTNTTSSLSKDVGNVRNEVGQVREVLREDGLELSPTSVAPHKRRASNGDAKVLIEEPEYMVHAVIPGRAWLKSSKGQITTVTEGDTIGNYGKILVIDAANGVVLTSSGVTFR